MACGAIFSMVVLCFLWLSCHGCLAGSSKVLEPFLNFLSAKARALEAQQNKRVPGNVQLAKQLAQLLAALGSTARSQDLLAAFSS